MRAIHAPAVGAAGTVCRDVWGVGDALALGVAAAQAAVDGEFVVDAGRQLVQAHGEHGVLCEKRNNNEINQDEVQYGCCMLISNLRTTKRTKVIEQ